MDSYAESFAPTTLNSILNVPPQKRSARACDQCREKKTKCEISSNGRCESCVKAGLACSYVHRTSTKHDRDGDYLSYLEHRNHQLRQPPAASPASRKSTRDNQQTSTDGEPAISNWNSTLTNETISTIGPDFSHSPQQAHTPRKHYSLLSGLGVLRHLHDLNYRSSPYVDATGGQYADLAAVLDQGVPPYVLFGSETSHLPPKHSLLQWIECALIKCPWLDYIVSRPEVEQDVDRLFSTQDFGKRIDDRDRLALIYAVLALGQRYQNAYAQDHSAATEPTFARGLKAFSAAREIVSPIDFHRNLSALAAGAAMALYLASCSAETAAHAYTSNVAAAALRLGLHEDNIFSGIPDTQRGGRRKLFLAIVTMDSYASSALGLPSTLRASGHDVTTGENVISSIPAAYVWLLSILNEASEETAQAKVDPQTGARLLSVSILQATGSKLDAWSCQESTLSSFEQLRSPFKQEGKLLLLKYTAAYVQMLIYSPFLHHSTNATTDQSFYATSSAIRCIDAAIWAIEIAELLEINNCFDEAYPLTNQILVFATTILLNVQLCSNNALTRQKSAWGCPKAIALLDRLATRSSIAAGCLACLRPLYEPVVPSRSLSTVGHSAASFRPTVESGANAMATVDDIASTMEQYSDAVSESSERSAVPSMRLGMPAYRDGPSQA